MNTVLVTGANAGLGFEACRQLAVEKNVTKLILACRNEEKANKAIEKLVELSGKPKTNFSFLHIDITDSDLCRKAASSLDTPIDGIIMNAGGMHPGPKAKDGSLKIMSMNLIGHAVFLQKAIEENKFSPNARIVYVGSFAARGFSKVWLKPPLYEREDVEGIRQVITGEYPKKYDDQIAYAYAKSLGALYMGALARKYPELYFFTVSPGMAPDTEGASKATFLKRIVMSIAFKLLASHTHSVEVGAQRYLVGLYGDKEKYPSGNFFGSKGSTTTGELVNQNEILPNVFGNTKLEDSTYEALQPFINFGL